MKKTPEDTPALARNDELVVQDLPDEVLVYDLENHKAHCLNKTAAFIWNHCDGRTTVHDIAKMMEQEWDMAVNDDAVWFALNKLSKADLLQERIILPEANAGMSRRSAIRRLGLGALMVPTVITIVSPAALAGASVPPACLSCTTRSPAGGLACPEVCLNVQGACFDNNSCQGVGSFQGCPTCAECGTLPGQPARSWRAGTSQCP